MENDYIPWLTAIKCLTYVIERMRRSTEGYEYMKVYEYKNIIYYFDY